MLRALLARIVGGGDDPDGNDPGAGSGEPDNEESGFLRSRLDASVLAAHGASTAEAERELDDLEAQSDALEEAQRARDP